MGKKGGLLMVSNRRLLIISILLLSIGISLNITLTQLGHFGGSTASMISIPISSEQGYFASGLALLAVMVTGLILLVASLKKKQTAAFVISLAAVILLPPIIHSIL
jgi:type IV secretory pathway VirB2 component (pilin)